VFLNVVNKLSIIKFLNQLKKLGLWSPLTSVHPPVCIKLTAAQIGPRRNY
jgi:hypothetical protein